MRKLFRYRNTIEDTFIETVLDTTEVIIERYADQHGNFYYRGKSDKFHPHTVRSSTSAMQCLLKFYMSIDEQRRFGQLLHSNTDDTIIDRL